MCLPLFFSPPLGLRHSPCLLTPASPPPRPSFCVPGASSASSRHSNIRRNRRGSLSSRANHLCVLPTRARHGGRLQVCSSQTQLARAHHTRLFTCKQTIAGAQLLCKAALRDSQPSHKYKALLASFEPHHQAEPLVHIRAGFLHQGSHVNRGPGEWARRTVFHRSRCKVAYFSCRGQEDDREHLTERQLQSQSFLDPAPGACAQMEQWEKAKVRA